MKRAGSPHDDRSPVVSAANGRPGYGAPELLRIVFSFPRGRGHLAPMLPLARAASAAGHRTALSGAREAVLEQTGFSHRQPRDVELPASRPGTGTLTPIDPSAVLTRVPQVFLGDAAAGAVVDVGRLVTRWSADLVVCGEFDFGAMTAAERAGVPCVVVLAFASAGGTWRDAVREPLEALRRRAGLGPDPQQQMLGGALTVVPFPASMRSGLELRGPVIRMRPDTWSAHSSDAAAWLAAGDGPRVYVTLGTEFNTKSGDLFARLIDALAALPARILLTTGPWVDPTTFAVPAGPGAIRIEQYVPQDTVLGLVDLVVNHGGSGSVTGALAHGVPLLVLPLGADQLPNGSCVETLGAGLVLDAATAAAEDIRTTASRLLTEPSFGVAAERVRTEIATGEPPAVVLAAVERLIGLTPAPR
ncbi:glycosyltransferase family 1 protein [Curtobacterium sp. VKM Ac-2852]|nr:glycosyltransferase family 1 protein [Curtobacterium sp. VKM Ac-2852]